MLGILVNMEKFSKIKGIAAPMLSSDGNQFSMMINIDTDMIIPKQFLKTIKRTGLGKSLFHEMRYDFEGNEIENFILNKDIYRDSKIILAGNNFGCGSSREHAPWALLDFGIKVIIAPSFADIFYNNCFKNGILPIQLSEKLIKEISESALKGNELKVSLSDQIINVKMKTEQAIKMSIERIKNFYQTKRAGLHFLRCLFGLIALIAIFN